MQTNVTGTPAPLGALANPRPITPLGVAQTLTPEGIRGRLDALTQPFLLELVEWRGTNTTRDRRGSRGQVGTHSGTGWTTVTGRFRRPVCPDRGRW